ncbi:acyl-CoA dehydrogenase family protein, partial [Chitiniphilus eburneus]
MLHELLDLAVTGAPTLGTGPADPAVAELCRRLERLAVPLRADPDPDPALDEAVLADGFAHGLFSLTVPRESGGLGGSLRDFVEAIERVAQLGPAYAITAVPHLCAGVKAIATLCPPDTARDILTGIPRDRRLLAFAITEETGSDVATVHTRLTRAPDGTLRLNGRKQWITNLERASHVVVVARSPAHPVPGATQFVCVPLGQPGVSVAPAWDKHCANGSDTADLFFDNVEIAPWQLLGEPGKGMAYFNHMVQSGRLGAAAACVGLARDAVALAAADPVPPLSAGHAAALAAGVDVLGRMLRLTARLGDDHHPQFAALTSLAKHICSLEAQRALTDIDTAYACQGRASPPSVSRAVRAMGLLRLLKGPGEVLAQQAVAAWLWQGKGGEPNPAWPYPLRAACRALAHWYADLAAQGGPSARPGAVASLGEATGAA